MSDTARKILLGIFLVGVGGIATELWLLGHYEELDQIIPLALAATVQMLQFVMLLFVVSGFQRFSSVRLRTRNCNK